MIKSYAQLISNRCSTKITDYKSKFVFRVTVKRQEAIRRIQSAWIYFNPTGRRTYFIQIFVRYLGNTKYVTEMWNFNHGKRMYTRAMMLKLLRGLFSFFLSKNFDIYPFQSPIRCLLSQTNVVYAGTPRKRKSQSIPSMRTFRICFVKIQSRFRYLKRWVAREIEKLSPLLVVYFSRGIYYRLA